MGLSNCFGHADAITACIAAIAQRFPDLGLVGYDQPDRLAQLEPLGFAATGPLTVWLKNTPAH